MLAPQPPAGQPHPARGRQPQLLVAMSPGGNAWDRSDGTCASSMATITTTRGAFGVRHGNSRWRSSPTSRRESGDARDAGGVRRHGGGLVTPTSGWPSCWPTSAECWRARSGTPRASTSGSWNRPWSASRPGSPWRGSIRSRIRCRHSWPSVPTSNEARLRLPGTRRNVRGLGGSYDYAGEGATHHSPADASLMLAIPGMEVLIPGHGQEVDQTAAAPRSRTGGRPTAHERRRRTTNARRRCPGRLEVRPARRGPTVLVAFGPMLDRVLAATEGLDITGGIRDESLRPFDHAGLRSIAGGLPRVLVVKTRRFSEGTSAPVLAETFRRAPAALGVHRRPARLHPRLRHARRSRRRHRPRYPWAPREHLGSAGIAETLYSQHEGRKGRP